MKIKVTDKNNEILAGVDVKLEIRNKSLELKTDDKGMILVEDAQEGDIIKYYASKDDITELKFSKNTETSLIIASPIKNMLFFVADANSEPVEEVGFTFRYLGKEIKKISNEQGEIKLSNIPINTEVTCYQTNEKNEVINSNIYKCDSSIQRYELQLQKHHTHRSVKFVFTDKDKNKIKELKVRFKIAGKEFEKTVKESFVVLDNIKIGSIIECKQLVEDKDLEWKKFKCDASVEELVFNCDNDSEQQQLTIPIQSSNTIKFRFVDSHLEPIPNAVVKFEVDEHTRHKYTDANGEVESDKLEISEKFHISVDVKGKKYSNELMFQGNEGVQQIVLKSNNGAYFVFLGILLALLVGIMIYAAGDFTRKIITSSQKTETVKKDTVIITNYCFTLKDNNNKALENGLVKLYYADTVLSANTNNNGKVKFKPLPNKLPTKYEISKFGFVSISQSQVKDSVFAEKMIKDSTIFINEKVLDCNTVTKSNGTKESYHTFKMKINKGSFKIWFNFFKTLNNVKVYAGDINNISKETLIFSTDKEKKGIYNSPYMNFDTKDGLVTVCITSSNAKSNWVSKIYCAKGALAKPKTTMQPKATTKPKATTQTKPKKKPATTTGN